MDLSVSVSVLEGGGRRRERGGGRREEEGGGGRREEEGGGGRREEEGGGGRREEEGGGGRREERGGGRRRERGREIKEGEGGWLAVCTLFLPSMQCAHTTHTSSAHSIGPDLCECIQHLTQQWWTILQYDILV